jgi:hypothetical protein
MQLVGCRNQYYYIDPQLAYTQPNTRIAGGDRGSLTNWLAVGQGTPTLQMA